MLRRATPILIFLAAAAVAAPTDAAAERAADGANFKRCLAGDPYCEMRKLSPQQRQRVFEQAQRHHLESCLAGRMCNRAALTPDEQARVQSAVAQLNFRACLAGEADCRFDDLTPDQRAEVDRAEHARNLERCLAGLTGCDESRLEPAQLRQARERASERNYALCLQGAFVDCRLDELSAEQGARVEQRRREANLFLCTHSLVGCVQELLTAEERAQVAATRPALLR
jgi:hypothetical protein